MEATVLANPWVRLEPLRADHLDALWPAADEAALWRHMTFEVRDRGDLAAWIAARRAPMAEGRALPYCIFEAQRDEAVGSTSLFDIDRKNRRGEIGHTWLGRNARGTGINAAAKLLLFTHAFDTLGLGRVQLKTDGRNERAQRAIAALGATKEGVLRRNDVLPDGHVRDAVVYSVLREEWPEVRARLEAVLRW